MRNEVPRIFYFFVLCLAVALRLRAWDLFASAGARFSALAAGSERFDAGAPFFFCVLEADDFSVALFVGSACGECSLACAAPR